MGHFLRFHCDLASLRPSENRFFRRRTESCLVRRGFWHRRSVKIGTRRREKEKVRLFHMEMTEQALMGHCSVCGRVMELLELPGRTDKFCLPCSADLATVILLGTEIDAATVAGRNTDALVAEFEEISSRMLGRAQSAH
jgi:hypothetical protein